MDFLRSCYSTQMQFDQAGEIVAGVKWYWAAPEAKLWEGHNAFCSSVWDDNKYATTGIGEVWNVVPTYSKGAAPYPSPGTGRFCGRHHWFSEGAPSTAPPLTRGPSGMPACCGGTPGLLIGGTSTLQGVYRSNGGVLIGGSSSVPVATCAAWHTGVQPGRSFYQQSTGTFWPKISDTGFIARFQDPANPFNTAVMASTTGPCIPGFNSTSALLFQSFPVAGDNPMNFVSGNNTTGQSIWKAEALFPIYPGQLFTFQMF
jgi:hypothetical protein